MQLQYEDISQGEQHIAPSIPAQKAPLDISVRQEKQFQLAALNLFTAVIVADEKIRQVEIDTYIHALKSCFSEEVILELEYDFLEEADRIKKILSGPSKRYWLGTQHMTLRNYPNHRLLLDKLWKISVSDNCLDSREAEIIDFFAYLWREN